MTIRSWREMMVPWDWRAIVRMLVRTRVGRHGGWSELVYPGDIVRSVLNCVEAGGGAGYHDHSGSWWPGWKRYLRGANVKIIRRLTDDEKRRPWVGQPLWLGGLTAIQPVTCVLAFGVTRGDPWAKESAVGRAPIGKGEWILKAYGGPGGEMDAFYQAMVGHLYNVPAVVVVVTSLLACYDAEGRPAGWYVDGTVRYVNPSADNGGCDVSGLRDHLASALGESESADMEAACPHTSPDGTPGTEHEPSGDVPHNPVNAP